MIYHSPMHARTFTIKLLLLIPVFLAARATSHINLLPMVVGDARASDDERGLIRYCRPGKCPVTLPDGGQVCRPCPRVPPPPPHPDPHEGCYPCLGPCVDGHCF